jgi:hypothetical protein
LKLGERAYACDGIFSHGVPLKYPILRGKKEFVTVTAKIFIYTDFKNAVTAVTHMPFY